MKMCAIQWMLALTLCGVVMAFDNHAQILEKKFTIKISHATFQEALKKISEITQVKFAYSSDQLHVQDKITLDAENRPLREILDDLFTPTNISYKLI